MRQFLIIAIALLAAILVMTIIKAWQDRLARKASKAAPARARIGVAHIIGLLVGLAVFFLGAVVLERGASGPWSDYQPATITDGKITSGEFSKNDGN